ncbi:MAG: hypothetical protein KBT68_03165 [bacterium]|nr:hypothetical protein [Candidatus Colisoma equi]
MKQRCENCPTKADCVAAFGIYWNDKSGGGVGCEHPFGYRRAGGAARQDGEAMKRRLVEKVRI